MPIIDNDSPLAEAVDAYIAGKRKAAQGRRERKPLMIAKCADCNKRWNISILAIIPKSGYLCPHCTARKYLSAGKKSKTPAMRAEA